LNINPHPFKSDTLTLSLLDIADLLSGKTLEAAGIRVEMDAPVDTSVFRALLDANMLASDPAGLRKKNK